MGSPIKRQKIGNTTVTRNLTTGKTTYSTSYGSTKNGGSRVTQSKQVGGSSSAIKLKTTTTRSHGGGFFSRTSTSKNYGTPKKRKEKSNSLLSWLFTPSKKQNKKSTPRNNTIKYENQIDEVISKGAHKPISKDELLLFANSEDTVLRRLDSLVATYMMHDNLSRSSALLKVLEDLGPSLEHYASTIEKYKTAYQKNEKLNPEKISKCEKNLIKKPIAEDKKTKPEKETLDIRKATFEKNKPPSKFPIFKLTAFAIIIFTLFKCASPNNSNTAESNTTKTINDHTIKQSSNTNNNLQKSIDFKPSIDCANARSSVDKSICSNPLLVKLDGVLTANYKLRFSSDLSDQDRQWLIYSQNEWVNQKNECQDDICLIAAYRNRITQICNDYTPPSKENQWCYKDTDIK